MNLKNRKYLLFILTVIGCIQSLILTTIAMFFYPGGTFDNPNTAKYSFWRNLFSDLGRTIAYSGKSNLISFLIYNISLFLLGLLLIPYFIGMFYYFQEAEIGKGFIKAGSILGIPIAVSFIGASLTPADLYYKMHVTFGFIAFTLTLPVIILYTIGILHYKNYPNLYAYVYIILAAMLFIFLIIMSFTSTEDKLMIVFAAGQNIIVYAITICFFLQAFGALKIV